jgi:hypothetical protein
MKTAHRTSGLTYAEYARQGFWQLLAAAALALVVVKGATVLAGPRTPAERLLLRALLGLLCVLTIVIVASSFHRLRLYESAFGLTRLRLAAEAPLPSGLAARSGYSSCSGRSGGPPCFRASCSRGLRRH